MSQVKDTLVHTTALGINALVIVVHFCALDVPLPSMKDGNETVRNITIQSD